MTATTTMLTQTLTGHSGNWSSGPLSAGAYTEMLLDVIFTQFTVSGFVILSRLDAFGNSTQIWGAARDSTTTDPLSIDFGPCDGYQVSHAWGAQVQVDILTTGDVTGTISLVGKG